VFRKTHIRLTYINSIVFIILISILASVIYFYTENRLYHDVNQSLQQSINHPQEPFPNRNGEDDDQFHRFMRKDPRIMVLIWDQNNELLAGPNRNSALFIDNEKQIRPKKLDSLQDVVVDNFSFRYIATKIEDPQFGKVTVQFVRNVDSEKELLDRLLLIILIGCGIGVLCAVGSGYFLAGRALVPIKNAWQKQQEFVSDASHELRTPLAVIQAKTDLLFRAPAATVQDKILDISAISNESRRLSKLVANLLTLARSDSDQIEMKKQSFRLDELLKEILQHYEEIIASAFLPHLDNSCPFTIAEKISTTGDCFVNLPPKASASFLKLFNSNVIFIIYYHPFYYLIKLLQLLQLQQLL
jgi:signal transduction histidine kinase